MCEVETITTLEHFLLSFSVHLQVDFCLCVSAKIVQYRQRKTSYKENARKGDFLAKKDFIIPVRSSVTRYTMVIVLECRDLKMKKWTKILDGSTRLRSEA